MKKIKNIIFDLGGVILNIDYNLSIKAFRNLGVKTEIYSQKHQLALFDDLEKGLINAYEFRNEIKKLTRQKLSDTQIDNAWNSMILDFPPERLNLLEKLSNQYNLFLFSNTNEIHYKFYRNLLKESFGIDNVFTFFEKEYYSHKIHLKKPDAEAFEFVLKDGKMRKEETLFIDDSIQHINSAKSIGIIVHHLQEPETIMDIFRNYVNLNNS